MARIKDYATLCQAIIDFSHRQELRAPVGYFVQFAENRIYRDIVAQNFGEGIRKMEVVWTATVDPDAGTVAIPPDYFALKSMQVIAQSANIITLGYKDAQWIYDKYPLRQADGLPAFVAREASSFIFGPFPDAAYSVKGIYYGNACPLSDNNPVSWLVTDEPDLLLAAAMLEVAPFMKDPSITQMFQGMYDSKLPGVVAKDIAERYSSATMQMSLG